MESRLMNIDKLAKDLKNHSAPVVSSNKKK
jgi:hypothetical protein